MIRLVVSDVDGTLLPNNTRISRRNREAVKKLLERGVKFALSTGRFEEGTRRIIESLALDKDRMAFSFDNGNHIKIEGKTVLDRSFVLEDLEEVLSFLKGFNCVSILYTDKNWFIEDKNSFWFEKVDKFYPGIGKELKFTRENLEYLYSLNSPIKIAIRAVSEDMQKIVGAFQRDFSERFCYFLSATEILEINYKGVSKASSLKFIADYYNIDLKDTLAIGDFDNDAEMIKEAGVGVCMQNGSEKAKEAANFITDFCENDGFFKAIEKFCF